MLKTPFGRGLALGLALEVADGTADGLAATVALDREIQAISVPGS